MKYFSMFSGIGGFDLALNRNGHECIGYSEIDKYAIQIYKKNFGMEVKNYGNATKINARELPDFEILCGGFPCQSFSIAGKRKGFKDTRGTLFFDICRIVEAKKPPFLLLENVKGLLSHNKGKTFATILNTLSELGYCIEWIVFNSKHFGVPQNRERVFIIGSLGERCKPKIFPFGKDTTKIQRVYKQKMWCEIKGETPSGLSRQVDRIYEINGISPTLTSQFGKQAVPKIKTKKLSLLRRLTPIECERLQNFPDSWTVGVSDAQRYKQLGNAVTINVVDYLVKNLFGGEKN